MSEIVCCKTCHRTVPWSSTLDGECFDHVQERIRARLAAEDAVRRAWARKRREDDDLMYSGIISPEERTRRLVDGDARAREELDAIAQRGVIE